MLKNKVVCSLASTGYSLLEKSGLYLQPFLLLFLRGIGGWQLYLTGKGKLLNHEKVVGFFTSLNIPFPDANAWFIGGLECFGGLLLLVGLLSRPVALLMAGNMFVAYLSVEDDRAKLLNLFVDPTPFLNADPFFFLLMSVVVLAFGPGLISIDAVVKKIWIAKCSSTSSGDKV